MSENKSMQNEYVSTSPSETKKLGKALAKKILKQPAENGAFVIALEGELGGGKTTFIQGFAVGLGIKDKILSPTFVILKRFKITNVKEQKSKISKFKNFYHIDCYRIKSAKEILDLGFKKITDNPRNIAAVEWAERIKTVLPKNSLIIKFEFVGGKERIITINIK